MDDFNAAQAGFTPLSVRDIKLQKSDIAWEDIGGQSDFLFSQPSTRSCADVSPTSSIFLQGYMRPVGYYEKHLSGPLNTLQYSPNVLYDFALGMLIPLSKLLIY